MAWLFLLGYARAECGVGRSCQIPAGLHQHPWGRELPVTRREEGSSPCNSTTRTPAESGEDRSSGGGGFNEGAKVWNVHAGLFGQAQRSVFLGSLLCSMNTNTQMEKRPACLENKSGFITLHLLLHLSRSFPLPSSFPGNFVARSAWG